MTVCASAVEALPASFVVSAPTILPVEFANALSGGLQARPVGSRVEVFDDFEVEGGDVVGCLQGLEIDDAFIVHVRSVDRVRMGRAVEFVSNGSLRLGDDDGAQGDIAD